MTARIPLLGALVSLGVSILYASPLFAEWKPSVAASRLPDRGEFHLGLFNGEDRDGYMRLGWYREGENLVLYDRTMMPSAEVYETLEATLGASDLDPRSVSIRFHQGTAILDIDARFEGGEARGSRVVHRTAQAPESQEIATEIPAGAMLRPITFVLPLALGTEPGQQISYPWYGPLSGQVQTVTLTSSDGGEIETPAGTHATTRWELRGGTPENDIYVTRSDPPQIVRIDVLGQPLRFLAVEQPTGDR